MQQHGTHQTLAEQLVIAHVLGEDHPPQWSRAELERTLSHLTPLLVNNAIDQLRDMGVLIVQGEQVRASPCARYLAAIEMLATDALGNARESVHR